MKSGEASAVKTHIVGTKVVVAECDSLRDALRKLRRRLDGQKPPYHLRRVDYYLKPSEKRRRKQGNVKLTKLRAARMLELESHQGPFA